MRIMSVCLVFFLFLVFAKPVEGQVWAFATQPNDGVIVGAPGETVGWGYEIHNESSNLWLVTSLVGSDTPPANGSLSFAPFDLPILAPGDTLDLPYSDDGNGNVTGLAAFTWDQDALPSFSNSGNFVLFADWFDDDPFNGGSPVASAGQQLASYQVGIRADVLPEPNGIAHLLGMGFCAAGFLARRRKNARQSA